MSTIKMTNHGGSRKGAGRKSKSGEKTVVKRIPASLVGDVNNLIDQARPVGS